jgi:6-phosphogluconolactonase (cycloisomerase 2 family)
VTHVTILCTVDSHRVGGRITGLNGRGLVLQNNAGDDLSIDFGANGDFAFAAPVASGAGYAVSVKAQPQFVHQTCTVTDGTGQVVSGPVRTVNVHCVLAAPSAQPARFAYVSGQGDNSLTAFHIDATTGALAPLPEPPTVTGRTPMGVSLHPNDRFVYVANNSDATVSAYVVQPNGMLVPARTPTVATGAGPIFLGIDPRGRFAYAVNGSSDTVSAYRIDATTGELTSVGTTATDKTPFDLIVDPTGRFVYVAHSSGSVSTHLIDPTTGTLSTRITTQVGGRPNAVTMHPTGRFVYVANTSSNDVSIYAADALTGALTPVSTTPAGQGPTYIAVDPTGRFAYVANTGGDVSAYAVDADTGQLTEVTPRATAGQLPSSLAIDPTGRFVYVTNLVSNTVSTYTLNTTTGALTPNASAPTVATGRSPQGIVLSRR